jgi:hypothetical protein
MRGSNLHAYVCRSHARPFASMVQHGGLRQSGEAGCPSTSVDGRRLVAIDGLVCLTCMVPGEACPRRRAHCISRDQSRRAGLGRHHRRLNPARRSAVCNRNAIGETPSRHWLGAFDSAIGGALFAASETEERRRLTCRPARLRSTTATLSLRVRNVIVAILDSAVSPPYFASATHFKVASQRSCPRCMSASSLLRRPAASFPTPASSITTWHMAP